jgi:hypothetical protein
MKARRSAGACLLPPGQDRRNVCHDGSEDVIGRFPIASGQLGKSVTGDRISAALTGAGLPNVIDKRAGSIAMASRLLFNEGEHALSDAGRARVDQLAEILTRYLGCLSTALRPQPDVCAGIPSARLDRLVLAAHVGGSTKLKDHLHTPSALTGAQALAVYSRLAETAPSLLELRNARKQPGFEFRGFGDRRPPPRNADGSPSMPADRIELILRMDVPTIPDDAWVLPPQVPAQ